MRAAIALGWAVLGVASHYAAAQVVTDGTLGAVRSFSGASVRITPDVGRQVGGNLFHSFADFNVARRQTVTFTGTADRVIARVTGGRASTINGTLASTAANGTTPAALYLVNPAGIVIGPDAQVNVPGSLVLTTADRLTLADGGHFDATTPAGSVLSSARPEAFGFLSANPGSLTVKGRVTPGTTEDDPATPSAIRVADGQNISLVGGDISVSGRALVAPSGRISVLSAGGPGTVTLDAESTSAPTRMDAPTGSIAFRDLAAADISNADGGGAIDVRGAAVLLDSATLRTDTVDASGGPVHVSAEALRLINGGNIVTLTEGAADGGAVGVAAGTIELASGGFMESDSGDGAGGPIVLQGRALRIGPGSIIQSIAGEGAGGAIRVNVRRVLIDGGSPAPDAPVGLLSEADGGGRNGDIVVRAGLLRAVNGGTVQSTTFGSGTGGDVIVTARTAGHAGRVLLDGQGFPDLTGIAANTQNPPEDGLVSTGPGGNVTIDADAVLVRDNAGIDSNSTYAGAGHGGRVAITTDTLTLLGIKDQYGTGINTLSGTLLNSGPINAGGPGGEIVVNVSGRLTIAGPRATFRGNTFSNSNAGNVTINAGSILIDRLNGRPGTVAPGKTTTGIGAEVEAHAHGNGGVVRVTTGDLTVRGGRIAAETLGRGRGGTLLIDAGRIVLENGGVIESASARPARARGGNVTIGRANLVEIKDGSAINARAANASAGNITIDVPGNLVVQQGGAITTDAQNAGGNIVVRAAVAAAGGNIVADAVDANGGNITFATGQFLASPLARITANSQNAAPGVIVIGGTITDVSGFLPLLLTPTIGRPLPLVDTCTAAAVANSFVVTGRGGLRQAGR